MQQPPDNSGGNDPSQFVEMDAVDLRYGGPDGTLALDGTTLSVARGGICRRGRSLRLRQVIADEARHRAVALHRRVDPRRRHQR